MAGSEATPWEEKPPLEEEHWVQREEGQMLQKEEHREQREEEQML